jgi:hypothetical protein
MADFHCIFDKLCCIVALYLPVLFKHPAVIPLKMHSTKYRFIIIN